MVMKIYNTNSPNRKHQFKSLFPFEILSILFSVYKCIDITLNYKAKQTGLYSINAIAKIMLPSTAF